MTQKTLLVLSAVLTAFVLVVGGGLLARVSQPQSISAAMSSVAPTPLPANTDATTQVQTILQQREAQYRQLLDQANQRLSEMNQQLAAASTAQSAPTPAESRAAATAARPAALPQPIIALSVEAARNMAIAASNYATLIREPELVRFEGKVAYEVGFTRGVIYVDAATGAILYNGTQGRGGGGSSSNVQQPPPASGGEHEHEGDSEGEHGDDHD